MSLLAAAFRGFGIGPSAAMPDPFPSWFTPTSTDELVAGGYGHGMLERAVGLPALLGVVLRTGQGVGMMPTKVYERAADGARDEAPDDRAYELLHERPSSECATPSAFHADIAVSLAGTGRSWIRKIKSRTGRGVLELLVEDPRAWKPRRSAGRLVFDRAADGGQTPPLDDRDLIYVRGLALNGGLEPLSPVSAHRLGLTTIGLQRQRFEVSHLENGARPDVLLIGPDGMAQDEAEGWVDMFDERHAGPGNGGKTAAVGGGFTVTTLPVSLADAQFVESNQWTAAQTGAVYGMPKAFLNLSDQSPTDADWRFWVTFGLGWITTAKDQAFNADRDLFPRVVATGSRRYCETLTDALLKPDIRTRYEAYKAARQAGWMTSNEIRRLENLPPHPDGDILQVIPVGGGEPSDAAKAEAASWFWEQLQTAGSSGECEVLRVVLERAAATNGNGSLAHL